MRTRDRSMGGGAFGGRSQDSEVGVVKAPVSCWSLTCGWTLDPSGLCSGASLELRNRGDECKASL